MCELTVSYRHHLNVLLHYTARETYNYSDAQENSACHSLMRLVLFILRWEHVFLFSSKWDDDADSVQEYDGRYGFLTSNTFYYTVKYKTITKHFYSQMYKIQDYITYFGYKQKKIFVQSSLIQYKNMNVSYKLLHFAAAVHWRLPSPFISEVFTWFKSDCGREVSKKHTNNHMALFHSFHPFVYFP